MKDYNAKVISNIAVGTDGYKIELECDTLPDIIGGQFAMIKLNRSDLILRRPFGIAKVNDNVLTFVYQLKGEGTKSLSKVQVGEILKVALPLGNGFNLENYHNIVIIGGGYGVIPLLLTASQLKGKNVYIYNGFASSENVLLKDEFDEIGNHTICTMDGSMGVQGFPTDAYLKDADKIKADVIITCGPTPLMRQVKKIGESSNIKTFVSLEQRMGCGVGACLVCTCKIDGQNKRACKDGPVFDSVEVEV